MIWRRIIWQRGRGRREMEGVEGLKKVEIENDWIRDWAWEREV